MDFFRRIGAFFLDAIETIVVGLALFVVCYLFLFQIHQIKGGSMEPNFHDEEQILTDKLTYRFRPPQRGEIVIFRAPKNRELDYVKRVIGLPGETIKVADGRVFINQEALKESYLTNFVLTNGGSFLPPNREFSVPENEYFVLGDNRLYSSDSREWGTVNKEDIIGRALIKLWPPLKFGVLAKVTY